MIFYFIYLRLFLITDVFYFFFWINLKLQICFLQNETLTMISKQYDFKDKT